MILELEHPERFHRGDSVLIDGDILYVHEVRGDSLVVSDEKPEFKSSRKPMRRGNTMPFRALYRPVRGKATSKAGDGSAKEYRLFMGSYRGLPCIKTGRTWFLRNEKGDKIPTCGHHLLPRSTYPEYKLTPENVVPVDAETHQWAEDNPTAFLHWLHDNHPLRWKWVQEHKHHRGAKK